MNKSTLLLIGSVGTLIVLGLSFYLGMNFERARFVNTPVVVIQTTNTDSLHNVWLSAQPKMVDSAEYKKIVDDLRHAEGKPARIVWKRDTVGVPVYYASVETSLHTVQHSVTMDEEDTLSTDLPVTVSMGIDYFPDLYAFRIRNLSMSPTKQTFTRKRSIVTERDILPNISMDWVFGYAGSVAGGAFVNYERFGVGGIFIQGREPFWGAKANIPINLAGHP